MNSQLKRGRRLKGLPRTGTFFCVITTAQSFPRMPIAVMFAAVIALKAYSVLGWLISSAHSIDGPLERRAKSFESRTDLI